VKWKEEKEKKENGSRQKVMGRKEREVDENNVRMWKNRERSEMKEKEGKERTGNRMKWKKRREKEKGKKSEVNEIKWRGWK
jgi:hypothetical protein